MTAPSVAYIESTTTTASLTLPSSSSVTAAAVGDLCYVAAIGTASGAIQSPPSLQFPSSTTGFAALGSVDSGTANTEGRIYHYWKTLVAGDFSGSNLKQLALPSAGTLGMNVLRWQIWIFHHANGWDASVFSTYTDTAGFTNGVNQTLNGGGAPTRPNVSILNWCSGTSNPTLQPKWDSGTARDPYVDDSSGTTTTGGHSNHYGSTTGAAQADYNEYDTGSGAVAFQINVGGGASHAMSVLTFQTAVTTVSGSAVLAGHGTFAATGVPSVIGTAAPLVGGGSFAATGLPTVIGTAALAGGGIFLASQQGITVIQGTAALAGGGTFAARQAVRGTAVLAGGGTFHATGTRTTTGSAALVGGGVFACTAFVGAVAQATGGTWAEGSASAGPALTWTGVAALHGGGTFHATGVTLPPGGGLAQFHGGGTFAAAGTRTVSGIAALGGGGTFAAFGHGLSNARVRVTFRPRQRVIVRE